MVKQNLKTFLLKEWGYLQNFVNFNNRDYKIDELRRVVQALRNVSRKGKKYLNLNAYQQDKFRKELGVEKETFEVVFQALWTWASRIRYLCKITEGPRTKALEENLGLVKDRNFVKLPRSIRAQVRSGWMREGAVFTLAKQLGQLLAQNFGGTSQLEGRSGGITKLPEDWRLYQALMDGISNLSRAIKVLVKDIEQLPDNI